MQLRVYTGFLFPSLGRRKKEVCKTENKVDDIRMTAGHLWTRVAQGRAQWKSLEEAYAKRHNEIGNIL